MPTSEVEMGLDPTRAYFWPAVNKRPTRLWPGYFLNRPEEIFFDPKGKTLKNLTFCGAIFQTQTQTIDGWPIPTWPEPQKLAWPNLDENFLTITTAEAEREFLSTIDLNLIPWWIRLPPASGEHHLHWAQQFLL